MHRHTALVLAAMGFNPERDFSVGEDLDGIRINQWNSPTPQPTEQSLRDIATGAVQLPSGQLFTDWLADHGGDAKLTRKRRLREAFKDAVNDDDIAAVAVRALIDVVADKLSIPRSDLRQEVLQRMIKIVE